MLGRRDFFFSSTAVAVMSAQVNGNQALAKEPKNGDKPTPEFTDQDRDYMRQAVS
jgi:hypothetical protein